MGNMQTYRWTLHRSEKNQFTAQVLDDPSIDEWNRALMKSGGEGGCKAEVIGKYKEDEYNGIELNFMKEYIQSAEPMEKSDQEVTEEKMRGMNI